MYLSYLSDSNDKEKQSSSFLMIWSTCIFVMTVIKMNNNNDNNNLFTHVNV